MLHIFLVAFGISKPSKKEKKKTTWGVSRRLSPSFFSHLSASFFGRLSSSSFRRLSSSSFGRLSLLPLVAFLLLPFFAFPLLPLASFPLLSLAPPLLFRSFSSVSSFMPFLLRPLIEDHVVSKIKDRMMTRKLKIMRRSYQDRRSCLLYLT